MHICRHIWESSNTKTIKLNTERNSNEVMAASLLFGFFKRLDGRVKDMNMTGYFCSAPQCPHNIALLSFVDAEPWPERPSKRLFTVTLDYEKWEILTMEVFDNNDGIFPQDIYEFVEKTFSEESFREWVREGKERAVNPCDDESEE